MTRADAASGNPRSANCARPQAGAMCGFEWPVATGFASQRLSDPNAVHPRRAELGPGHMPEGIVGQGDTRKDTESDAE